MGIWEGFILLRVFEILPIKKFLKSDFESKCMLNISTVIYTEILCIDHKRIHKSPR